jgi:hypothetical protein
MQHALSTRSGLIKFWRDFQLTRPESTRLLAPFWRVVNNKIGRILLKYILTQNGRAFTSPLAATSIALALLGTGCGGNPDPNPPPVTTAPPTQPPITVPTQPQYQSSFPAKVFPMNAPPYACGQTGAATLSIMSELNKFWQSSSLACSCQSDFPMCQSNALAGGQLYGYIYYDANFLNAMASRNGVLAANLLVAHEFGHNIQTGLNLFSSGGKYKELQADCLAGFYAGFQIRQGLLEQSAIAGAFRNACESGDPSFSPWWVQGQHGTCNERMTALDGGIRGYLAGAPPLDACPSL